MESDKLQNLRHSLAHLLAAAVLDLYPDTKNAIGPPIENGFYYDFDFVKPISEEYLPKIENKMRDILKSWDKFEEIEETKDSAQSRYIENQYKNEIIQELATKGEKITSYKSGGFTDLCRGGHTKSAKDIDPEAFKLTHIAGAYWRGSEKNKMLTRIYGVAFETRMELDKHLRMIEEAKKRDHKKIGFQLELFMFHETAPGMPYWLPKGMIILNELIEFWRDEHKKRGYLEVASPILNKKELYIKSGHYEHYWNEMFIARGKDDEDEYGVKAMNCPNAMVIFDSKQRSYKDLPLRFSDTDSLHRFERSGVLNALLRTREFRQDDAHCFVKEDQIENEYRNIFEIVERFYSIFNLKYRLRLGTRPEGFLGDINTWDKAESILKKILKEKSNDELLVAEGDGAFYGPKVDIIMKDAIGRDWQMGTIQLDFHQPLRFGLTYTDNDGKKRTPIVIHRVIYGSLERFIALLIENYGGAFPLWLAPVQAVLIPVSEKQEKFAREIHHKLKENDIRAEIYESGETLPKRIREAELQKIPYILVVGEKEEKNKSVNVRHKNKEEEIKIEELIEKMKKEIEDKTL